MRDYINGKKGLPLNQLGPWPNYICDGDPWGYGFSMEDVRKQCSALAANFYIQTLTKTLAIVHSQEPVCNIDIMTFADFIDYGMHHADHLVHGEPWSFDFMGLPITHENNECYLIPNPDGGVHMKFTPRDILIIIDGRVYMCRDITKK